MLAAFIIMFVTALGNSLIFAVLKNPFVTFFWYHLFICGLLPVLDNYIIHRHGLSDYLAATGLIKPVKGHYLVVASLTGILALISISIAYIVNKPALARLVTFELPVWLVITGAVYTVFFNSFLEEIFWRGYMHSRCLSMHNRPAALALNALFFTSFHVFILISFLGAGWITFVVSALIFGAGILFSFFREQSKSIIPSLILHFFIACGYTSAFLDLMLRR